jgi:hypothetical protein
MNMTIKEFVDKNRIEMKVIKVNQNPNFDDQNWQADHYEVTLERWAASGANRVEASMTTYYSKGIGHKGKKPNVAEVLDCIMLDSDALDYAFEDWCFNLGHDSDSIKASKTYELCRKQAKDLMNFLGIKLFNELKECERL